MRFIRQILIIFGVTLAGELLNRYIPIPVPASIYGLVIMLILLMTGIIKKEAVSEAGNFLLEVMPLMFIPAAAGVVDKWSVIKPVWFPTVIIIVVVTVIVMIVTGVVTQFVIDRKGEEKDA